MKISEYEKFVDRSPGRAPGRTRQHASFWSKERRTHKQDRTSERTKQCSADIYGFWSFVSWSKVEILNINLRPNRVFMRKHSHKFEVKVLNTRAESPALFSTRQRFFTQQIFSRWQRFSARQMFSPQQISPHERGSPHSRGSLHDRFSPNDGDGPNDKCSPHDRCSPHSTRQMFFRWQMFFTSSLSRPHRTTQKQLMFPLWNMNVIMCLCSIEPSSLELVGTS